LCRASAAGGCNGFELSLTSDIVMAVWEGAADVAGVRENTGITFAGARIDWVRVVATHARQIGGTTVACNRRKPLAMPF
jgi:hypothetical protein